jgi:hypothetical protein
MSTLAPLDLERLNSFYVTPHILFKALHCVFSRPQEETGAPLNCLHVLNPSTQFLRAVKKLDSKADLQAIDQDELNTPLDVLALRAIALMRVIADYFADRGPEPNSDRLRAELDKLWARREFIIVASFTALKSYANGDGAPYFDPGEFISNIARVRETMGKHLGHLPLHWGAHSHH